MKKFRRSPIFLFFFWFVILSLQNLSAIGENGGEYRALNKEEKPSLAKIVIGTISSLRKSRKNSWDKVKSIIHEMQLKFSPPNLDFRGANEEQVGAEKDATDRPGEKMKDAAKKSVEVSKMTVEESAKSAAEAVHRTAEKVKDSVSGNEEFHDEL